MAERSIVAAILANGLLAAVQPGADSRLQARHASMVGADMTPLIFIFRELLYFVLRADPQSC
jgi:hypothetical protein